MELQNLFMMVITGLVLIISILVGVAYLTLLERKVLSYIQNRKGPNKVGMIGVMQPFGDGLKLFFKEGLVPLMSNYLLYYMSPSLNLFLALMLWLVMPMLSGFMYFNYGVLFFLCLLSISVYTIMLSGWSSNSNYSLLGSLRAIAQTVSYEVSLSLILLSFLFLILSLNFIDLMKYQSYLWFIFMFLPLCSIWLISSLAETNRTPFDLAEGESELVSGFNIEYSSGGFAFIFLAEYSNILFMSMMCVMLFLGANFYSVGFYLKLVVISFFWIWVRGTLPRMRYDKLMNMAWKQFLSIALNYLFFYMSLKMLIFNIIL